MVLVVRLLVNAAAIGVAVWLLPGLSLAPSDRGFGVVVVVAVVVAALFGLVNAVVRPLVVWLARPLYALTLGLVTLVVNALMLGLTAWLSSVTDYGLRVDGFWDALVGGVVVSVVSFLLSYLLVSAVERRQAVATGRA